MSLISLLVFLIVIGLVFWAVHHLAAGFGIPGVIINVIDVILVVVCVLYLLQFIGLVHGVGLPRL